MMKFFDKLKVTSNLTGELGKQLPSVEDIQNRIK